MTHSILVIEDNPDITRVLQDILANAGYRPTTTSSGLDGLSAARELNPDLIVLDLGLPDINGGEVARRVRQYSSVPIIILTAVDVVDRKVDLLEAGVNDYITKPFDPDELLARINVQFRRQEQEAEAVLQVGELCIQVAQRRCTFASREITLTAREFDLLLLLARPPGKVRSRQEIEEKLWKGELPESSGVLEVHLSNLRAKLREVDAHGVIRTIRGQGYALQCSARDPEDLASS